MTHSPFEKNITNTYGKKGKLWLSRLPSLIEELSQRWGISNLTPFKNMSFHYVGHGRLRSGTEVVLKIGCDSTSIKNEGKCLKLFQPCRFAKLLDQTDLALLIEAAIPGLPLLNLYPAQVEYVMEKYAKIINQIRKRPHTIEQMQSVKESVRSLSYKNFMESHFHEKIDQVIDSTLKKSDREILLHGDLHLENILSHGDEWICIDPKGVVGEITYEVAAFDFLSEKEVKLCNTDLLIKRIEMLARKTGCCCERLKAWTLIRSLLSVSWFIEDNGDPTKPITIAKMLLNVGTQL